jgi:hypothetical protein
MTAAPAIEKERPLGEVEERVPARDLVG